MERFVLISGCSGGGKSTLLAELGRRGHEIVEEPGRRIVAEALAGDGSALPWIDLEAFARKAIDLALADRQAMAQEDLVFFDRGLVDAASALSHTTGEDWLLRLGRLHRYHPIVFMTPPWPEIYAGDSERRHDLSAAISEYDRLLVDYPKLGYEIREIPRAPVPERADFVLDVLLQTKRRLST